MLNNEKGITYIFVVIALSVLFIFTMTLIFIGNTNAKNVHKEENNTKAYYVAKTGAEGLISHISDQKNIKTTLDDFITKTKAGDYGTGEYEEGKFEIKVEEEVHPDGTSTYKIKSKATVKDVDGFVTAILNPNYKSGGWGDGQVFVDGDLAIPHVPQMVGSGLKLYTRKKKTQNIIPIIFEQGPVAKLFKTESNRWGDFENLTGKTKAQLISEGLSLNDQVYNAINKENKNVGDYSLVVKERKGDEIIREVLENKSGGQSIELNYSYDATKDSRFDEPVFPNYSFGTSSLSSNEVIQNSKNYSEAKFNSTNIIDASGTGSDLLITAKTFEIGSNQTLTIKTNSKRSINIVTNELKVLEKAKIDIEGDGVVNFYLNNSGQLDGNSSIGIKDGIKTEPKVNIYLKSGSNFQAQNGAKLINVDTIGSGGRVDLQDGTVYEGVIVARLVDLKDKCSIKSPTTGSSSINVDEIIDFKKITWEK